LILGSWDFCQIGQCIHSWICQGWFTQPTKLTCYLIGCWFSGKHVDQQALYFAMKFMTECNMLYRLYVLSTQCKCKCNKGRVWPPPEKLWHKNSGWILHNHFHTVKSDAEISTLQTFQLKEMVFHWQRRRGKRLRFWMVVEQVNILPFLWISCFHCCVVLIIQAVPLSCG